MVSLREFLDSKGAEYAPFDPQRAKNIYTQLAPHLKTPAMTIHIIGTNGKGSTGRFITLGLLSAGKSVLHFTSPHLFSFNERFYKNGKIVTDTMLEEAHAFLQQFACIQACSYFEYATFLATFLAQDVEFLVLEAGLGGEYDSTSCLKRDISVFTPIGLDHQEILGTQIQDIATTKLKAIAPIAFLAPQYDPIIKELALQIAHEYNAKLYPISPKRSKKAAIYASKHHLPEFLAQNFQNALCVLEYLDCPIDPKSLPMLDLIGRCQKIAPNITIDVGHNAQAAQSLLQAFSNKKINLVYNTYKQKDVLSILKILAPITKKISIIAVQNERIIETSKLKSIIATLGIAFDDFCWENLMPQEEYLVFGSFSVIKQFLEERLCKKNSL
ncbi:hypothetical protein BKH46_02445 [Helicobacter sp. 12S02634-8]|nr:hypothetical protein BKH46_02445 [Helicobacter sp. 12S02634-8]